MYALIHITIIINYYIHTYSFIRLIRRSNTCGVTHASNLGIAGGRSCGGGTRAGADVQAVCFVFATEILRVGEC